ncbi:MAG TPA: hypothetical protein VM925_13665, partial [Labilithrix sp.]|nr:hypothetical protein [Labilithrix sp.]
VRTFPAVPSARGRSAIRPPAPAASRLGEEIARLAEVRTKLSAGDTAGAHSALDAYAREFGAGMLAPEAAALRIDTFVAAGNRVRALEGAHRYLADFPTGPAAPRMHGLVASVGASSP